MTEAPGLYIHVPFCARRCPYCDFYSINALELIPRYIEALAREARAAAPAWPEAFETLYIGGGSPSLLNREGLSGLWRALEALDLSALKEITLEANPEDVSPEQAELWAEMKVSRLSLGLQTLDERWLGEVLGRTHSAAQSRRAAEILRAQPYDLCLDLIYGLPAQEPEAWGADLLKAAELEPDHISTYGLTVEPGTALARSVSERLLPPPPPPEKQADLFLISSQALNAKGFYRYEVSNFARPGHESRHNLKYWRRQRYLGLGPSAHSFDGQKRWANLASVRQWISALSSGAAPRAFTEEIEAQAARLETLMLGLRLDEGLPESALAGAPKLRDYLESGYLIQSEGRIRPTEKGLLIADRLALEFSD
ncbi:MAG: radical SAM family heme chaperone HemW [Candidatus Adiutrix sp.]|jgi:oxygen-independent coproporphyrinogen-3 oxidase|nr:radical SAM family heme chaperone HemW [Candidatus Adiutrix sp.]